MLRRFCPSPPEDRSVGTGSAPRTRVALWTLMRRDPTLVHRFPQIVEQLARRLSEQQADTILSRDEAREYDLGDLAAADRWWKRRWRSPRDVREALRAQQELWEDL